MTLKGTSSVIVTNQPSILPWAVHSQLWLQGSGSNAAAADSSAGWVVDRGTIRQGAAAPCHFPNDLRRLCANVSTEMASALAEQQARRPMSRAQARVVAITR